MGKYYSAQDPESLAGALEWAPLGGNSRSCTE
jgi:hypothetical protein